MVAPPRPAFFTKTPVVFWGSAGLILLFVALSGVFHAEMEGIFKATQQWIIHNTSWFQIERFHRWVDHRDLRQIHAQHRIGHNRFSDQKVRSSWFGRRLSEPGLNEIIRAVIWSARHTWGTHVAAKDGDTLGLGRPG
jgi:hypothetical protein